MDFPSTSPAWLHKEKAAFLNKLREQPPLSKRSSSLQEGRAEYPESSVKFRDLCVLETSVHFEPSPALFFIGCKY